MGHLTLVFPPTHFLPNIVPIGIDKGMVYLFLRGTYSSHDGDLKFVTFDFSAGSAPGVGRDGCIWVCAFEVVVQL